MECKNNDRREEVRGCVWLTQRLHGQVLDQIVCLTLKSINGSNHTNQQSRPFQTALTLIYYEDAAQHLWNQIFNLDRRKLSKNVKAQQQTAQVAHATDNTEAHRAQRRGGFFHRRRKKKKKEKRRRRREAVASHPGVVQHAWSLAGLLSVTHPPAFHKGWLRTCSFIIVHITRPHKVYIPDEEWLYMRVHVCECVCACVCVLHVCVCVRICVLCSSKAVCARIQYCCIPQDLGSAFLYF